MSKRLGFNLAAFVSAVERDGVEKTVTRTLRDLALVTYNAMERRATGADVPRKKLD